MLRWEDFPVGWVARSASVTVSAQAIVAFAQQWDPQAFHLDDQASRQVGFGGLIASGVHGWAITQRLAVDTFLGQTQCLGSPGYDNIRFLNPLRPNTEVVAQFEVTQQVASASRPDRGRVLVQYRLIDASTQQSIVEASVWILVGRRPPGL
jgi:acyl dehydratase